MIPVTQTRGGGPEKPVGERGNCMAAAIASILELPIERVEIPERDDQHWMDSVQETLRRLGYAMVMANPDFWPDTFWLAGVASLNARFENGHPLLHMIVMHGGVVAHDPSRKARYKPGTPRNQIAIDGAYVLVPLSYVAPPSASDGEGPALDAVLSPMAVRAAKDAAAEIMKSSLRPLNKTSAAIDAALAAAVAVARRRVRELPAGETDPAAGLPDELRVLFRDQSVVIPKDAAVFDMIAEYMEAPSATMSAEIPTPPIAPAGESAEPGESRSQSPNCDWPDCVARGHCKQGLEGPCVESPTPGEGARS